MRLLHLVTDAKWVGRVEVQSEAAPGSASSALARQIGAQGSDACRACLLTQDFLRALKPSLPSRLLYKCTTACKSDEDQALRYKRS